MPVDDSVWQVTVSAGDSVWLVTVLAGNSVWLGQNYYASMFGWPGESNWLLCQLCLAALAAFSWWLTTAFGWCVWLATLPCYTQCVGWRYETQSHIIMNGKVVGFRVHVYEFLVWD